MPGLQEQNKSSEDYQNEGVLASQCWLTSDWQRNPSYPSTGCAAGKSVTTFPEIKERVLAHTGVFSGVPHPLLFHSFLCQI